MTPVNFLNRSLVSYALCKCQRSFRNCSLCEREWDHGDGQQQKQVKSGPNKMRFNVWPNYFFHKHIWELTSVSFSSTEAMGAVEEWDAAWALLRVSA
jgi:hypothetical protein